MSTHIRMAQHLAGKRHCSAVFRKMLQFNESCGKKEAGFEEIDKVRGFDKFSTQFMKENLIPDAADVALSSVVEAFKKNIVI